MWGALAAGVFWQQLKCFFFLFIQLLPHNSVLARLLVESTQIFHGSLIVNGSSVSNHHHQRHIHSSKPRPCAFSSGGERSTVGLTTRFRFPLMRVEEGVASLVCLRLSDLFASLSATLYSLRLYVAVHNSHETKGFRPARKTVRGPFCSSTVVAHFLFATGAVISRLIR